MLRAQRSRVSETREETDAGAEKTDIAVTPLAIPMLSGPGAISTVVLLQSEATTFSHQLALCGCILLVSLATYGVLRMAAQGAKAMSPIALRIGTRVMGLLLAAGTLVAFQLSRPAPRLALPNGLDTEPPVTTYVLGGGWRNENEWPLARQRDTELDEDRVPDECRVVDQARRHGCQERRDQPRRHSRVCHPSSEDGARHVSHGASEQYHSRLGGAQCLGSR